MFNGEVCADRSQRTIRGARLYGFLLTAVLLALVLTTSAFGQATEGTILGAVIDPSRAAVSNATVTITSVETGAVRTTTTTSDGEYVVTNLPLGSYTVAVEAQGFKKTTHPAVEIQIKSRIRVDIELQIGAVAEVTEITSANVPRLQTDTPEVGGVVSRKELQELPVINRNFLTLASLAPGTTGGGPADRRRDFNQAAVTISGASSESNNFIIDGISNNEEFVGAASVFPPIDAIQEFKVQTSQYSAEFGRSGGGIINIAIKSGTNQFHGSAYDYLRNDALDARPFFDVSKNPLRQNQFGFTLGGPVKKDKLFFFGNYEGLRLVDSEQFTGVVPTPLEKNGDFTQSGYTVYNPNTTRPDPSNSARQIRDPFPGNVIPTNRISPIGAALLNAFPNPNFSSPGIADNYLTVMRNTDNLNAFNIKVDANLTANDLLTVRYTDQRSGRVRPSFFPNQVLGAEGALNGKNSGITYSHTFSPRLLNEFRFGYNQTQAGNEMVNHDEVLGKFNIPGLESAAPDEAGYPWVDILNIAPASTVRPIASLSTPFIVRDHGFQWLDSLSYQRGDHALKFGAEVDRVYTGAYGGLPDNAFFGFPGLYTSPEVGAVLPTGIPDALLGLSNDFDSYSRYLFDPTKLSATRFNAYIQDYWRVNKKLTLSLGLRYDVNGRYHDANDVLTNFDLTTGVRLLSESTRSQLESQLGGSLPQTYQFVSNDQVVPHTNWRDFAPRFGFAYEVSSRMVVRGGYGLFYGVTVGNNYSNAAGAPFDNDIVLPGTADVPVNIANGFPRGGTLVAASSPGVGGYYTPLEARTPYTQKWNVDVQVSPAKRTVIDVGYVGQHALGFPTLSYFNVSQPGAGSISARRPFPDVGDVLGYLPINDSKYNALEINFKQDLFHGLSFNSAFTYSRAYAYASGIDEIIITNPFNFRYDWGPASYDIPKRWVTGYTYNFPAAPKNASALGRQLIGNWQIAGLITVQDGLPFSVGLSQDVLNNGLGQNRPDLIRNPNLPAGQRTLFNWFDTAAFTTPALYTYGNEPKNILRGPGFASFDFSVQKTFPFGETKRLVYRFEAGNLFNRGNFGLPNASFGGTDFGVIRTLAGQPRNIQMALRVEF